MSLYTLLGLLTARGKILVRNEYNLHMYLRVTSAASWKNESVIQFEFEDTALLINVLFY